MVYKIKISFGQESVKDAPYSGKPRSAVTKSNIKKIKSITIRQLVQMTNLGLASVNFIQKKIVKVTKISARWDPHWLTNEHTRSRMRMAKQLLKKYTKYQKKMCLIFS